MPCFLIALVWAATRAYPLSQAVPWHYWEVWEAKKLLDYGFFARHGGIINIHFMTGMLPDPWRFNYVNHPYPILWLDTLAFSVGGQWGPICLNAFFGLAACIATYFALKCSFGEKESLIGAILFTLAPTNIAFDINPDQSAQGALMWPFAMLALHACREKKPWAPLGLGLVVFLAGQISWSTYSIYPVLLLMTTRVSYERGRGFAWMPDWAATKALMAGAVLTVIVFLAQIALYTHNWQSLFAYLGRQAGTEAGVSMPQMYFAIGLRTALSLGPALLIGMAAGVAQLNRQRSFDWRQLGVLSYPIIFVCATLLLKRYFYREHHLYAYLVLPLTFLTVEGLCAMKSRALGRILLCLAVVNLAYPLLRASIPTVSLTSVKLGQQIRSLSRSEQAVGTNIDSQKDPFESWDVGAITNTQLAADRMLFPDVTTRSGIEQIPCTLDAQNVDLIYVWNPRLPVDETLRTLLEATPPLATCQFVIPDQPPSIAAQLRSAYWKLIGKYQVSSNKQTPASTELRVYHFHLKKAGPASIVAVEPVRK